MNAPEDKVPERLQRDLHELVPGLPDTIAQREREFLAQAHEAMRRGNGRRVWGWPVAGMAAAAMVMLVIGLWQMQERRTPMAAARPTIVDALLAAKRPGVRQAQIDQIAMAAVRLDRPEVQ